MEGKSGIDMPDGPTGPRGPTGHHGPTGVATAFTVVEGPQGREAELLGATGASSTSFWMRDGEWYAFRLEGRDFFARARNDLSTGYLELTEIDNPYSQHVMDDDVVMDFDGG